MPEVEIPDRLMTVTEIAELLGEPHHGRVLFIVKKLGLPGELKKTPKRGKLKAHYNADAIRIISALLQERQRRRFPESKVTASQLGASVGCSHKTVRRTAQALGLVPSRHLARSGREHDFYDPWQAKQIRRAREAKARATEYTVADIQTIVGRSQGWVQSHIASLGLKMVVRRMEDGKIIPAVTAKGLELLEAEAAKYPKPSARQLTRCALADRTGIHLGKVKRLLDICSVRPVICWDKAGHPRPHYDRYVLMELRIICDLIDSQLLTF